MWPLILIPAGIILVARGIFKSTPGSPSQKSPQDYVCPNCGTADQEYSGRSCRFCGRTDDNVCLGSVKQTIDAPIASSANTASKCRVRSKINNEPNYLPLAKRLLTAPLRSHLQLDEIPNEPGLYVWYFDDLNSVLDTSLCSRHENWKLLYLGVATKSLRNRTKEHFTGDTIASGAIRESVGALLARKLNLKLTKIGTDWVFGREGDRKISEWLYQHARVACVSISDIDCYWPTLSSETERKMLHRCEKHLINHVFKLPLNRDQERHDLCSQVCDAWKSCREVSHS